MSLTKEKHAARIAAMARRKAAHTSSRGAGEAAARHLLSWLDTTSGLQIISGYMPIHTELDSLPALQALHARGYQLSLPVIMGKAKPLKFRHWAPDTPMVKGPFGAMIPETGAWLRPDLMLCPLLAFDASGQRLGYGGGFYDRSIAALAPVRTLGFAYSAQQVPDLPHEATDIPLEGVVTEAGIVWQRH